MSEKTGGRWLISKHRAATALKRLAIRHKVVGLSLKTTLKRRLPLKVFAFDDGTQPYGFHSTFKRMLAASGLSKDRRVGNVSLQNTYVTVELLTSTDIHTVARQMGTSVLMLKRHYIKLTATMAAERLSKIFQVFFLYGYNSHEASAEFGSGSG